MNEKQLEVLREQMASVIDKVMEERLRPIIGEEVAGQVKKIVEDLRLERALSGKDKTGLSDSMKRDFVKVAQATALGEKIDSKANEALIEEQDNRGGYLVATEVANAILRIAASVGLISSQAQRWPMSTDEKLIPKYTGAFLEGEFLGVDVAGSVTGITFAQARLIIKKWQLAFVVGNDLLADAGVDLADWLLALGGEALANMFDKQGFAGTGAPFVGLLESSDVTVFTLPTGEDTFAEFDPVTDASDVIAQVEESVLNESAWYMERTVWAKIRAKKDSNGQPLLSLGGQPSMAVIQNNPTGGGVKIAGEMMGYPVFTNRHFPANSASAVSTKFMVFGNMKAMAIGDRGEMRVEEFRSGDFGGKEIARADQRALIYKRRLALTIALGAAFAVVKTAAS
ncbi:MAG: phage major capsid protein [Patescibacteria group bacterium]|nr:phage major capsid protein [Patescibacteria group bacterium]